MSLQKLVLSGPPGSSVSIGPTSLDLPAWVQAVGSIAAILIAIYLSGRAERKAHVERVTNDACFASYVQKFLNTIGDTVEDIAHSIDQKRWGDEDRRPRTLSEICQEAFEAYDKRVLERVRKFVELPLIDWPDIELANAFYDASLQMRSDLERLQSATHERVRAEIAAEAKRLQDNDARQQYEAKRAIEEEDEAEHMLGNFDDGEVVRLPPRGQRRAFVSQMLHNQDDDDDSEFHFQESLAEEAAYEKYIAEAEVSAQLRQDRESLHQFVFIPLMSITEKWARGDEPLNIALERHRRRAIAAGVSATYEERDTRWTMLERLRLAAHRSA